MEAAWRRFRIVWQHGGNSTVLPGNDKRDEKLMTDRENLIAMLDRADIRWREPRDDATAIEIIDTAIRDQDDAEPWFVFDNDGNLLEIA